MRHLVLMAIGLAWIFGAIPAQAQEAGSKAKLEITDARLGRGVEDREITGEDSTFTAGEQVYVWMRVVGGPSDPITVTWKVGEHSSSYQLQVGGSPWRTWACKTVASAGEWEVTVADPDGGVLRRLSFHVR
jgi:hypothetical protein